MIELILEMKERTTLGAGVLRNTKVSIGDVGSSSGVDQKSRANQFFKLGNVARISEPTAPSARRAERQWGTLQSKK
jgi:hypothetical protein